uniref:Uncharacterized protein n=1 Tax=Anguilla anguilla TaxID=7936 RepID=A0A0E9PHF6_ANGAN
MQPCSSEPPWYKFIVTFESHGQDTHRDCENH